jgi:DnaJ-class molecular chaperone
MSDDCKACGGAGWLPSLPEGKSACPYCNGTGKEPRHPKAAPPVERAFAPWYDKSWLSV